MSMILGLSLYDSAVGAGILPYALVYILARLIYVYILVIVVWAMLSWFGTRNKFVRDLRKFLGVIVEPYVGLFKKIIPPAGMMDFSPFVAILVLYALSWLLAKL